MISLRTVDSERYRHEQNWPQHMPRSHSRYARRRQGASKEERKEEGEGGRRMSSEGVRVQEAAECDLASPVYSV